jgi:hypothetical protein
MTKIYRINKNLKVFYFPSDSLIVINNIILSTKPIESIRAWFPYFAWVSHWDCDSARYYTGHEFFAWNLKDYKKKCAELNRYSDGTRFREIGLISYLKIKMERVK